MTITRRGILGTGAIGIGATAVAVSGPTLSSAAESSPALMMATEFGVKPGAGDQSVALQAAINAAIGQGAALILPGGRILAGDLIVTGPLVMTGVPGSTVIEAAGGRNAMLSGTGTDDVTLSGVTFDATRLPPAIGEGGLLSFENAQRLRIENCRISGSPANGLVLQGCSGAVTDCEISGARLAALFSNNATGLLIVRNHVHDCANNGILVWQSAKGEDGTIVTQNRITKIRAEDGGSGQNGNGINVFRASGVVVSDNRITDCSYSAIRINSGDNCHITGNSCERLTETAIYVEFGFQGAVVANNLVDTAEVGISITNFNEGGRLAVCSGNVIRNIVPRPGWHGIGIGAEADTAVTGNVVENVPNVGIGLGWGRYARDLSASSNIVRNCQIGIGASVTSGAGAVSIIGNTISGTKDHAIAGMERDKPVITDLDAPGSHMRKNLTVNGNVISA